MSSTDRDYTKLAEAFFDEILEPHALARRAAGSTPYFPMGPDPDSETYFEQPSPVSRMTAADFGFLGCGNPSGLIEALGLHWLAHGEPLLAGASPRLGAIADAIARRNLEQSADVDIFCYTLF